MISLALAALSFVLIHIGVSGTRLRDRLVAAIGLRAYMLAFSVASVAAIIWLVNAYRTADYAPTWGQLQWWKPVMIAGMLPAFLLVVVGLLTPTPTAVGAEALVDRPPRGIVRVTRHPFLMGVALWAGLHLVGNGDWASLLFFGSLFVAAVAGAPSIDAKRRRSLGPARWDAFAARTSVVPFGAVLAGRTGAPLAETSAWRVAVAVLLFALMLGGHSHLVGVSPFPDW